MAMKPYAGLPLTDDQRSEVLRVWSDVSIAERTGLRQFVKGRLGHARYLEREDTSNAAVHKASGDAYEQTLTWLDSTWSPSRDGLESSLRAAAPAEKEPDDERGQGQPTYADVKRDPRYWIAGPGRSVAEQTNCSHGYRLTDSCPMCDADDEAARAASAMTETEE
jgi:hypothetical protein